MQTWESDFKTQRDCAAPGLTRDLSNDVARTHRACAQELGELRRVIDGSSEPYRLCPVVTAQNVCWLCICSDSHREVRDNDCTDVRCTRAVRAWRLFLIRSRLRCLGSAMSSGHISNCVRCEIADEQQHGQSCEDSQKLFAMQELHRKSNG